MQIGFLNEIARALGGGDYDITLGDKCIMFGGDAVYAEGHEGIDRYNESEIVLKLKKGSIRICGEKLKIMELSRQDILVKGVVKQIVRE